MQDLYHQPYDKLASHTLHFSNPSKVLGFGALEFCGLGDSVTWL